MGISSKLVQRITKTSSADVMHSSGYAKFQNRNNFGVASNSSFSQRQAIEQQRKTIQSYGQSQIGSQRGISQKIMSAQEKQAQEIAKAQEASSQYRGNLSSNFGHQKDDSFRNRQHFGGADTRRSLQNHSEQSQSLGYGRTSAEQLRQMRQDGVQRFGSLGRVNGTSCGITPAPKTGGFQGNFGRH